MLAPKPQILFFNPVRHAVAAFDALRQVVQADVVTSKSRREFFDDITAKYNNAQAIYRTSASGAVSSYSMQMHKLLLTQAGGWQLRQGIH